MRVRARQRRSRKKNNKIPWKLLGMLSILCLVILLLFQFNAVQKKMDEKMITLKVNDEKVKEGQEKPVFSAVASTEDDKEFVLNQETGYRLQDLIDELNRGIGYTIECESDGSVEGTYPIKAELTSEITTPLYAEWLGKVRIEIEDGTFLVENAMGTWDGDRFKTWEGTYLKEDFVTSKGKTYYFDSNGEKSTGWKEIMGQKYFFNEDGSMKIGWYKSSKGTYYFDDDGRMYCGWLDQKKERYYFDYDGKMLTGKQKIGTAKCEFDDKGRLQKMVGGIDPEKPMIALTFDDGPGKYTDALLTELEKNESHATFFMLGINVVKYPDSVKRMLEIGCELGNHSYNHPNLTQLSEEEVQEQVETTNRLISDAAGRPATVLRPPYGAVNDTVASNVHMPMILWSVDTLDWKTRNADKTVEHVLSHLEDGEIILFHDIYPQTVEAVTKLIPLIKEKGYQLVTVSELSQARNIKMADGTRYTNFSR